MVSTELPPAGSVHRVMMSHGARESVAGVSDNVSQRVKNVVGTVFVQVIRI